MYLCGLTLTLLEFGRAHAFVRSDNPDWNGPPIRSVCYDGADVNWISTVAWVAEKAQKAKETIPCVWVGRCPFQRQRDSEDARGRHGFRPDVITGSALAHRSPRGFRPDHGSR